MIADIAWILVATIQGGFQMKTARILVFCVVVASLTLVAVGDRPEVKEFELKFKGDGYFDMVFDAATGDLVSSPRGGFDLLNVSHLGLSQVVWELRLDPVTFAFRSGTFTITGANGRDGLEGDYTYFVFTPDPQNPYIGTYVLGWNFAGGTGRFENATGTGHTDGSPDFAAQYAEFTFSGNITVPKGK